MSTGDSRFRSFLRSRVVDSMARAIQENDPPHSVEAAREYETQVYDRLRSAPPDTVVIALCARKGPLDANVYYPKFFEMAERLQNQESKSTEALDSTPGRVRVCRLFLCRDEKLPDDLEEHYNRHKGYQNFGVYGLLVRKKYLESGHATALASMNDVDNFGFVLFYSSEGTVAYSHVMDRGAFQFAEWREEANLRQFFSLFDYLFVRSDEFRDELKKASPGKEFREFDELRKSIVLRAGSLHAPRRWLGADALLDHMSPSGWPRVYVLGSFEHGITFYNQQVRALNLAWALSSRGLLGPHKSIAVVGGGIAGMTFALAAGKRGCDVHLYDEELLHLQSNSDRYLHPHLYEWPQLHAEDSWAWKAEEGDSTGDDPTCGVLNWEAGPASQVYCDILCKWKEKPPNVKHFKRKVIALRRDTAKKGEEATLLVKTNDKSPAQRFHLVVLAIGFGNERTCFDADPYPYWNGTMPFRERLERLNTDNVHRVLVAGNGDGGLIDLAATAFENWEHHEILNMLKDNGLATQEIRAELLDIEEQLASLGWDYPIDSWKVYRSRLLPRISAASIQDLKELFHARVKITFCSGEKRIFRPDTSTFNRYLAFLVLEFFPIKEIQRCKVTRCTRVNDWQYEVSFEDNANLSTFETVLPRFGTERVSNSNGAPEHWKDFHEVYGDCKHLMDVGHLNLTRFLNPAAFDMFCRND